MNHMENDMDNRMQTYAYICIHITHTYIYIEYIRKDQSEHIE